MCALFGWLDCGKILSVRVLKKLTQALANAAEERGTDASGISYIKPDNWDSVMLLVASGAIRPVDAMKELGITRSRYYYLCERYDFKRSTK